MCIFSSLPHETYHWLQEHPFIPHTLTPVHCLMQVHLYSPACTAVHTKVPSDWHPVVGQTRGEFTISHPVIEVLLEKGQTWNLIHMEGEPVPYCRGPLRHLSISSDFFTASSFFVLVDLHCVSLAWFRTFNLLLICSHSICVPFLRC